MVDTSSSPHRDANATSATTFDQTWSPSAANAFDTATLPLHKARKAWERRPQPPRNHDAKYKKVWRTYGLRSAPNDAENVLPAEAENDSARAVKRMCINDSSAPSLPVVKTKPRKNYAGTKFDRRKSGITRKVRVLRDVQPIDGASDEQTTITAAAIDPESDKSSAAEAQESGASPEKRTSVAKRRKAVGRHSLGARRTSRLSFGGISFASIPEEPAKEVEALCLSPRKKLSILPSKTLASQPSHDDGHDEQTPGDGEEATAAAKADLAEEEQPNHTMSPSLNANEAPKIVPEEGHSQAQPQQSSVESSPDPEQTQAGDEMEFVLNTEVKQTNSEPDIAAQDVQPDVEEVEEELAPVWADETTTHLDLDTALLKDFLTRTAAAKATRLENGGRLSLPRRASLQNRRDSDAVRTALASPRKPLDSKDPNSPAASPIKMLDLPGVKGLAAQLDAITGGPLGAQLAEADDEDTTLSGFGSRRSARQRSRLPGLPTADKTPNKISVKRTDGSDLVVVKKTEAQELSVMTRSNTRRNKGTSQARLARLKKLKFDGLAEHWTEGKVKEMAAINLREEAAEGTTHTSEDQDDQPAWKIPANGEKGVRWRAAGDLLSFFGGSTSITGARETSTDDATLDVLPASSLAAPSVTSLGAQTGVDSPRQKAQPARLRRLRGLGAVNGTPGKGMLSSGSLLPDDVAEEKEKSKLPAPRERKSRIVAPTPKKVKLTSKSDEPAPTMLKAPEVSVPKSLSMSAATSLNNASITERKEVTEARERRLASPRKIPQFASGLTAPSAGSTRRKRMG